MFLNRNGDAYGLQVNLHDIPGAGGSQMKMMEMGDACGTRLGEQRVRQRGHSQETKLEGPRSENGGNSAVGQHLSPSVSGLLWG